MKRPSRALTPPAVTWIVQLRPSLFDARENIRHDLRLRLRPLRAAVVETHAHRAGFHVATADDQHRVDAQLFRVGNLRLERRRAKIRVNAHHVRAQFGHDGFGVVASSSLSVMTRT